MFCKYELKALIDAAQWFLHWLPAWVFFATRGGTNLAEAAAILYAEKTL